MDGFKSAYGSYAYHKNKVLELTIIFSNVNLFQLCPLQPYHM